MSFSELGLAIKILFGFFKKCTFLEFYSKKITPT